MVCTGGYVATNTRIFAQYVGVYSSICTQVHRPNIHGAGAQPAGSAARVQGAVIDSCKSVLGFYSADATLKYIDLTYVVQVHMYGAVGMLSSKGSGCNHWRLQTFVGFCFSICAHVRSRVGHYLWFGNAGASAHENPSLERMLAVAIERHIWSVLCTVLCKYAVALRPPLAALCVVPIPVIKR
jgi:hypothetical protein